MIIEKDDISTLDLIRKFQVVGNNEITLMQNFMTKYIDKNVIICRHCTAQIKHAWNKIINWANNNSEAIEAVRNAPEPTRCSCGQELPDKRYKYCGACKTK